MMLSLAETLDTLVPLLREVGDPVPLVTFQGNSVISPPLLQTCPAKRGKVVGGLGLAMLGQEAWVLRPRLLRRGVHGRRPLFLLLHLMLLLLLVSDNGALRGLKSLAREKYDPSHTKCQRGGRIPEICLHA
jgi:hypothetical protein